MRIVFAGTPAFAVPSLRTAHAHGEVIAAYTQPDRPAGRGRGLTPSPIKLEAIQRGIPVLQPETLKRKESQEALRAMQPDLLVVVAYGLILPRAVLEIEVNAVTDNPLVWPGEGGEEPVVLSGGNFYGQPVAQALDLLAMAAADLASVSERRT